MLLLKAMGQYRRAVILTGAGISAESGIKTFRDSGGWWENYRLEEVASLDGFERNPGLVQQFYNERRRQLLSPSIIPNSAHQSLSHWEKNWPGEFLLVTQNIDNLHERAGNQKIIHLHGELLKARCRTTGLVYPWEKDITPEDFCPCCQRPGTLRPHIVWFGEMPLSMIEIYQALGVCDLFVAIGTSGQVYPAAGFVKAIPHQAHSIEVNLEPSLVSNDFQEHLHGLAGTVLPSLVERFLAS
jgi:NAD-dependent deacetylase